MSLLNLKLLLGEFGTISVRACHNEDIAAELNALVERCRDDAKTVRGRLKVQLAALEVPEAILPNKLTDPTNIALRTFYRDAIARLTNMLGDDQSITA
jgi:hypothetical protein